MLCDVPREWLWRGRGKGLVGFRAVVHGHARRQGGERLQQFLFNKLSREVENSTGCRTARLERDHDRGRQGESNTQRHKAIRTAVGPPSLRYRGVLHCCCLFFLFPSVCEVGTRAFWPETRTSKARTETERERPHLSTNTPR